MSTSNEDDLRDILDKTAQEIAQMYSNPRTWQSWMVYLLGRLEAQATQNACADGILQRNAGIPAG